MDVCNRQPEAERRGPIHRNAAFWRALHGLSHDVPLAAVFILLVNDHVLRVWFPSWITGKLGDFAWLVFAPFICALVCSWLIRGRRQESIVGAISFGFIGSWFALAKTVPLINGWTIAALTWLLGYRGALRVDPTDLLALPGLWLGWRVWRSADNRRETVKPRVWALIALGVMATVATSAMSPQFGIGYLCRRGTSLYAFEFPQPDGAAYHSEDGGRTWTSAGAGTSIVTFCEKGIPSFFPTEANRTISDGVRLYRGVFFKPSGSRDADIKPGGSIESSGDDGKTWVPEINLSHLDTEARAALYMDAHHQRLTPGPLDAIATREGNLVLAMGTDGVLIHEKDGQWQWVEVGKYHHEDFGVADRLTLLGGGRLYWPFFPTSLIVTIVFTALAALTIGRPFTTTTVPRRVFLVVVWILFGISWLPTPISLTFFGLPFLLPIEGVLLVVAAIQIYRVEPKALAMLLALSIAAGALFLLPFVLWAFDTVPGYFLAQIYAYILGAAAVVSCRLFIRRRHPEVFRVS